MRVLYLMHSDPHDRSFGGAIRSDLIRDALLKVCAVDTVVIRGAPASRADPDWDSDRVRRVYLAPVRGRVDKLRQWLAVRRDVRNTIRRCEYAAIIVRYMGLAIYVPFGKWSDMVLDADDIEKSDIGTLRAKTRFRNAVVRFLLGFVGHAWHPRELPGGRQSDRWSTLPNVVALPEMTRLREPPVQDRILMVGYFEHPPNAEGVSWFIKHVLSEVRRARPGVELHCIGKVSDLLRSSLPEVVWRGYVDDLASEYDRASLVVAPVLSGGGTQIKVIDALGHGRPLVASRFAYDGFAARLGEGSHLLVAESADQWVTAILSILAEPTRFAAMASAGEQAVRASFGLDAFDSHVRATVNLTTASGATVSSS